MTCAARLSTPLADRDVRPGGVTAHRAAPQRYDVAPQLVAAIRAQRERRPDVTRPQGIARLTADHPYATSHIEEGIARATPSSGSG
jgi:hypothetical protein